MVVIALGTLRDGWEKHAAAEQPLRSWYDEACDADWSTPMAVKAAHGTASILKDGRVVFNIKGNDYRLVVYVKYKSRTIYVRWFGTHDAYDKIDAQRI